MKRLDWFEQCSASEKEALYRAELEHYSEKMVLNLEGRIVFINDKYAAEFGLVPGDVEGSTPEHLFSDRKMPLILDMDDFATPYVPGSDQMDSQAGQALIRAPLLDNNNQILGHMIYDGWDWLRRYRMLSEKLSELLKDSKLLQQRKGHGNNSRLIGNSPVITQLRREILLAAKTNATVLIEGETGTGKEVIANEIYHNSNRSKKPFIKINCAALPATLIESELFGYEDGAFTGAKRGGKIGLFEEAGDGIIMLDEINSLALDAQAKLLRVLQERVINRIGGGTDISIKARVIAISNQSLEEMSREGTFREDLYYRLNVIAISSPPLRTHLDDIPQLTKGLWRSIIKNLEKM